jgi:hypothetical protein
MTKDLQNLVKGQQLCNNISIRLIFSFDGEEVYVCATDVQQSQEVEDNIQACKQIRNEELDVKEHDNEYEQIIVDLNLEKRVNNIICSLETLNVDYFAKDYIPLIEKEGSNLVFDPSHDKHGADCFMYSFVESRK